MQNPNEYDDEGWARYSSAAQSALTSFWEAGASEDDIAEVISNALGDAGTDVAADVTISPRL